jgi:hypothetical protein
MDYCCYEQYTWAKFDNPHDIPEYYNRERFAVAFQINKPKLISDIKSETTTVPNFQHFDIFKVNFKDGFNTNDSEPFEKSFIYFNRSEKNIIFYTMSMYDVSWRIISCMEIDNEFYLPIKTHVTESGGDIYEDDCQEYLGEYFDILHPIINTDKYVVERPSGNHLYYGVIGIKDLIGAITK